MKLVALFRLAFASAPHPCLTSLHNVTRRSVLQKVRYHTFTVLYRFVSIRFQVLFHSPPGVLFTFPSRYWFTIGCQGVFSLGGWSPRIPTGFLVSRGTWDSTRLTSAFVYRIITFCDGTFQTLRLAVVNTMLWSRNPEARRPRFGLLPVRSPLLGKSIFLSFPPLT